MPRKYSGIIFEVVMRIHSADSENAEILKKLLLNIGVAEEAITEYAKLSHIDLAVYFKSRSKAYALKKNLIKYHLNGVSISIKSLKRDDWKTKWKKEFKPFSLAKTFGVVPFAYRNKYHVRKKTPIYIDTDLAFGTGLHATTRFMAQFVERCRGKFSSFADLGTGTGILSIIAVKCGAKDVMAIDNDLDAIRVARKNCVENDCNSVKARQTDVRKYRAKKQYDFVAANLNTDDLIQTADRIINFVKPGKYLTLSGISLNNYNKLKRVYNRYSLRCIKIEKGEGWVALLYKKLK